MRILVFAAVVAALLPLSAHSQRRRAAPPQPSPADVMLSKAPADVWRAVDPENLLVIDLPSGPVIAEMRPDFAPRHVERVKTLARADFYNGTIFHRVIDGFMAQGGDPTGTGRGGSDLPDLEGRFLVESHVLEEFVPIGRDDRASRIGFLGSLPVGAQIESMAEFLNIGAVGAWPLHCPGVLSMARAGDPNSANSQFFIMFGDNRSALDQSYTAWGRVVEGEQNVKRINRGEPPERPTPLLRARIMADLPAEEQKTVEVLRAESETFKAWLQETGALTEDGFFVDACSVNVPVRINGEIT